MENGLNEAAKRQKHVFGKSSVAMPEPEKPVKKEGLSSFFSEDSDIKKDNIEEQTLIEDEVVEKFKEDIVEDEIIEKVDGEIYIEPLSNEQMNSMGSMDGVMYKTGEVALMLNISEQTLRNTTDKFHEFIKDDIEVAASGHRRYSMKAVETLKLILQLRNEKKLTIEQTIEFLSEEGHPLRTLTPEKKWDVLLQLISQQVNEAVKEAIISSHAQLEDHERSIESSYEKAIENSNMLMGTVQETIKEQSEVIEKLSDQIKQYQEMLEQSEIQKEEYKKQFEEIKNLQEQIVDSIKDKETKKKGFLSIFSK